MKVVKFFSMLLCIITLSGLVGCDKDADIDDALNDYYISVEVSGGGLNDAELKEFESNLNSEIPILNGYEKKEAIYVFDRFMEEWEDEFYDGLSGVKGTLKLTFYLKTIDGKTVKKSTLNVTKDGCSLG